MGYQDLRDPKDSQVMQVHLVLQVFLVQQVLEETLDQEAPKGQRGILDQQDPLVSEDRLVRPDKVGLVDHLVRQEPKVILAQQVIQELRASRDPEAQQDHRALLATEEILVLQVLMGSQDHKDQLVTKEQLVQRVILGLLGQLELKEAQVRFLILLMSGMLINLR